MNKECFFFVKNVSPLMKKIKIYLSIFDFWLYIRGAIYVYIHWSKFIRSHAFVWSYSYRYEIVIKFHSQYSPGKTGLHITIVQSKLYVDYIISIDNGKKLSIIDKIHSSLFFSFHSGMYIFWIYILSNL